MITVYVLLVLVAGHNMNTPAVFGSPGECELAGHTLLGAMQRAAPDDKIAYHCSEANMVPTET